MLENPRKPQILFVSYFNRRFHGFYLFYTFIIVDEGGGETLVDFGGYPPGPSGRERGRPSAGTFHNLRVLASRPRVYERYGVADGCL